MNDFLSVQNKSMIKIACGRMLFDKFELKLSDEKIDDLINKVSQLVQNEYRNSSSGVTELNTITLSKIKNIYQKFRDREVTNIVNNTFEPNTINDLNQEPIDNISIVEKRDGILDDNVMNFRLKELEKKRAITPVYYDKVDTLMSSGNEEVSSVKTPSVSFTLQPNIAKQSLRKTFVINTAKRDWKKNPKVNDMKMIVPFTATEYLLFPEILMLPSHVSQSTPFVRLEISNGNMKTNYIFTLLQKNVKWDKWSTSNDIENTALDSQNWYLKLYDLFDNEIDLGTDDIVIQEVEKIDGGFKLKINTQCFDNASVVNISTYTNRVVQESILNIESDNSLLFITNKNQLKMEDFIGSVAMNTNNQYCLIINYVENI